MANPASPDPLDRLAPQHLDMLRDGSKIADDVIRERGYYSETDTKAIMALGFDSKQCRPGLILPLHTTDGQNGLYVLRPDKPRQYTDKAGKTKTLKYELPKNEHVRLDCPPRCQQMLGDPSIPLWLTEGQKKADALASQGACSIALLGVWNFKGKNNKGGVTFLADWDHIALNGRDVRIAYDSDITDKPSVRLAMDRLTVHLQQRGAHVATVYLQSGPNKTKQGVDDFLANGHTMADLEALVEAPRPAPSAAAPILEILDTAPVTMRRPLSLIDGRAYAAAWVYVKVTKTEGEDKQGNIIRFDPPLETTEQRLLVIRGDGKPFGEIAAQNLPSFREMGVDVALAEPPPQNRLWSAVGMKRYIAGYRPDPLSVFERVRDTVDAFLDFNRSLATQRTMAELVACYNIGTWMLPAFSVVGFLWPNGDRGSGKTQLLLIVCELAYLGQVVQSGGSFASLRDMADYGATLAFDDAESLSDPRTTDPDKRTLLLAGNRRGSVVPLKEPMGDGQWRTRYVDTFCPRLFSAIEIPDPVLASRTIVVPLVRTIDKKKGNSTPVDYTQWPTDRQSLIDDLWALALANLPDIAQYEREVCQLARLEARNLEPWRGILTIARWLDAKGLPKEQGKDDQGNDVQLSLYDRLESLSWRYQTERPDLESTDLTVLAIRALIVLFERDTPAADDIKLSNVTNTTNVMNITNIYRGDTPLQRGFFPFTASTVKAEVEQIATDEGISLWCSPQGIGKVLAGMRLGRAKDAATKKRSRYWLPTLEDIERLAQAYGLPIPTNVRNVLNVRNVQKAAAPGGKVPGSGVIP